VRQLRTGALLWAAWTTLAAFFAVTTSLTYISQGRPALWGPVLAQTLAQWWIWAALTPVVLGLVRRWPIARPRRIARVTLYLAAGVVIAFAKATADGAIRQWIFGVRPYLLISNLALQMAIYWALVAGAHAVQRYGAARARAAEAEARLGQAQLHLLRAQLQPHFLFNALGSIAELVHEDADRADRMVGQLSDLLRATLDVGDRQEVTLAEELALLRSYVAIQQTRFGDRLTVVVDVPDECLAARVPFLLLQPLVENAIRHGFSARAAGGGLRVAATCAGPSLALTVEDDGAGPREGSADGVGLTNTRGRLEAMYGPAATVSMTPVATGGAIVRVSLPLRSRARDAEAG
jgi:signal transduction histidine kinase